MRSLFDDFVFDLQRFAFEEFFSNESEAVQFFSNAETNSEEPQEPEIKGKDDQPSESVVSDLFGQNPFEGAAETMVSGTVVSDLDGKYIVKANNEGTAAQNLNFSTSDGAKEVYLYEGDQNVTFNSEQSRNVAIVAGAGADGTVNASGDKNITLGNKGDAVIVDSDSTSGNVSIAGGTGNDTLVVRGAMETTFDMGDGKDVLVVTENENGANVALTDYNYEEDVISVQVPITSIEDAVTDGETITFDDGGVIKIKTGEGVYANIDIDDDDSADGWLVRLADPDGNSSLVGFTGENGGTVGDASLTERVLLVGNYNGEKSNGSMLQGGTKDDTIYAGALDSIASSGGKDLVILDSDKEDGAVINISEGTTSIQGANRSFDEEKGDVLFVDDLDMDKTTFEVDSSGNLVIKESGEFKAIVEGTVASGGFVQQLVSTDDGNYRVAIGGGSGSTIKANDDVGVANVFIGNKSLVDFTGFTGEALIDLGGDWQESSIDSGAAYFQSVNNIKAGDGKMILKGGDGNETLSAGAGAASLYGAGGRNVLQGYTGSDKDAGSTFIVLGAYNGAVNTIKNFDFSSDYADMIEFDVATNHIKSLSVNSSNAVVFEVENAEGVVERAILEDAVDSKTGAGKNFNIAGTVAQVGKQKLAYNDSAEYYYATGANATLSVGSEIESSANVWLDDPDSGKTFGGDIRVIDAKSFKYNAELAGNMLDNTIYGGKGDNSMWGGFGGNDLMVGNSGTDNFVYLHGNGNDTIQGAGSGDTVWLGDITLDQISVEASNSGIVLNINDGGKLNVVDGRNVDFKVSNGQGGFDTYRLNNNRQFEQQ